MTSNPSLPCLLCVAAAVLAAAPTPGAAAGPTLAFDIVDAAGWRGSRADAVPASVTETYAYDAASDTVTVAVRFDRKGFAPLPPMLALAVKYGFPAEFGARPVDTGLASVLGPLVGFDSADGYTWKVKGLGRYVFERPSVGDGKVPDELQDALEKEVAALLEAGHLAPWMFLVNVPGSGADSRGDIYWQNPGEVLYLLAELAPVLRPETRARLIQYAAAERENFPPETRSTVPLTAGARREIFSPAEPLLKKWDEDVLGHRAKQPPGIWNLYGLARYYELTGSKPDAQVMADCRAVVDRSLEHRDWPTLYWRRGHTPGFNAVHEVNRLMAGLIGYVRLARRAGDAQAEALGWGLLARAAALRFAMGKYARFMHEAHLFNVDYSLHESRKGRQLGADERRIRLETDPARYTLPDDPAWWATKRKGDWMGDLVTWNWSEPIHNVRQVHRLDETGADVWEWCGTDCMGTGQKRDAPEKDYWYQRLAPYLLPFRDMTPEVARFLADHLGPECRAFCDRVAQNQPHGYVTYAEAILGAEIGFNVPSDAYGQFLARAWVLGETPARLERCVDVPWLPRGDLYHLHKLAETIKAHRGVTWRADAGRQDSVRKESGE